jgi:putative phosphoesterase
MKLALISDIHGNLPALEAVVADIHQRGVDQIVCLGDHLSGPLLPRETARYLMSTTWVMLAGNHERQVLSFAARGGGASDHFAHSQLTAAEFEWMSHLKPHVQLSQEVFLCHGTPRSDCEHLLESPRGGVLGVATSSAIADRLGDVRSKLVACGHSHVPRSVRLGTGQLVVNPGSVGLQAYTDDHPSPYTMELGTPDAHYAIVECAPSGWQVAHHAVPYDAGAMAKLAVRRGRPEWASALLRGYVG